jgi:phosphoglycerate kinase
MVTRILTLEDLDLDEKRVFLRVDINTPVHPETGELMEQTRLEEASITIRDLSKSKVVVASHQGRVARPDYVGMEKHAKILSRLLGKAVPDVGDVFGPTATRTVDRMKSGEVILLDNLRFTAEENQEYKPADAEKTIFINRLVGHFDACVLDAFSTAHRSSPSIVGFAELIPTCAGRVVAKELKMLERIFSVEKGPYVTVLGGAKVGDRIEAIDALISNNRADKVLLSGLVGLVFLKALGRYRGSLGADDEAKFVARAKQLLQDGPERFEVPIDVAINVDNSRREVDVASLKRDEKVLDIGSKTIDHYARLIKGAGTVFMSGPPGAFEYDRFGEGTEGLMRAMGSSLGTTIVSGGHLSTALHKFKIHESIDHVSTAGGALVQYLAGKRLPLIDALERAAKKWGG